MMPFVKCFCRKTGNVHFQNRRPSFDMNPAENAVRREIIRKTYENAVANGGQQAAFVDGETLYGQVDRDMSAVDGTHPNDLGFWRMAEALWPMLQNLLYAASRRSSM